MKYFTTKKSQNLKRSSINTQKKSRLRREISHFFEFLERLPALRTENFETFSLREDSRVKTWAALNCELLLHSSRRYQSITITCIYLQPKFSAPQARFFSKKLHIMMQKRCKIVIFL